MPSRRPSQRLKILRLILQPPRPVAAAGQWRASKLVGVNIYNEQNDKIGEINDVIIDGSGKVDGVVVSVGGFLGMGDHDVMMKLNQIKFEQGRNHDNRFNEFGFEAMVS